LFTIPSLQLPNWLAGVSLGGPVTAEALLTALQGGLRLSVILLAFGAANCLSSPRDLLRSLPGVFHEVAVAVTVALCFTPALMASVKRLHEARTLRGRPTRGIAGMRGILVPALEDALESATTLAASMGSRGFGRSVGQATTPRLNRALVVLGVLVLLVGGYGLLATSASVPLPIPLAGLGVILVGTGVVRSHRRAQRTRYRRAPRGRRGCPHAARQWSVDGVQPSSHDARLSCGTCCRNRSVEDPAQEGAAVGRAGAGAEHADYEGHRRTLRPTEQAHQGLTTCASLPRQLWQRR